MYISSKVHSSYTKNITTKTGSLLLPAILLTILKITSKLRKLSLTQLTNLSLLNPINPLAKIKHARSVSSDDASFVWFLFDNIIKYSSFCDNIKC